MMYNTRIYLLRDLFQSQIINRHISTKPNPAPSEPFHLTNMRMRHCLLRSPNLRWATHED